LFFLFAAICVAEREREREKERKRERGRDREGERERDREGGREHSLRDEFVRHNVTADRRAGGKREREREREKDAESHWLMPPSSLDPQERRKRDWRQTLVRKKERQLSVMEASYFGPA
jgi:hypothetical protein